MPSIQSLAAAILSPVAVFTVVLLVAAGYPFSRRIAQRLNTTRIVTLALISSIALILGLTLGARHWMGTSPTYWLLDGAAWNQAAHVDANAVLNAILFVPAGAILAVILGRLAAPILVLAGLSFLIEHVQMATGWGAPDPADFLWNTLGATAGVVVGRFVVAATRKR